MGRYGKIIFYILLLSFVFLYFNVVFKSCGNNAATTAVNNGIEASSEAVEELEEELFEDDLEQETMFDDEISYSSEEETTPANNNDEYEEVNSFESDEAPSSPPPSNSSTSSSSSSRSNAGSSSGRYMVITGSYLVRSNAETMVNKLSKSGYSNSEIVVFDNSQYNSVVAGRYSDYASAIDISNQLKRSGIDAYVHKRK